MSIDRSKSPSQQNVFVRLWATWDPVMVAENCRWATCGPIHFAGRVRLYGWLSFNPLLFVSFTHQHTYINRPILWPFFHFPSRLRQKPLKFLFAGATFRGVVRLSLLKFAWRWENLHDPVFLQRWWARTLNVLLLLLRTQAISSCGHPQSKHASQNKTYLPNPGGGFLCVWSFFIPP